MGDGVAEAVLGDQAVQSSEKAFLPGSGNGWLKCCATVQFFEWAAEHFESDSQNLAGMFLPFPVLAHVVLPGVRQDQRRHLPRVENLNNHNNFN